MSSITGLGIREKTKGGWHPKGKDGQSKESWRGDFKGVNQVAGWMGKKKSPVEQANEHVSRPIHTLKDPSSFGPPPKNVNYHGGAALPNQTTPDRSGLGAPLSLEQIQAERLEKQAIQQEEEEEVRKPTGPFRSDTTGLSTAHLPPPPGRRDSPSIRSPPPSLPAIKGKPPSLPPRLPPRQNSSPIASPPPSSHTPQVESNPDRGILNRNAINRLGSAGVSVPGFGIGSKSKPQLPPTPARETPTSPLPNSNPQLGELQSRFSKLSSSSSSSTNEPPKQGTTFAQKQAALKTVSSLHNDPSSVSLDDARSAANTANNFRERHGEQVKSGWQSANRLNTKYGIADKVNSFGQSNVSDNHQQSYATDNVRDNAPQASMSPTPGLAGKKKPPPPPVKRTELSGNSLGASQIPPPIPLGTKPKPSSYRAPDTNQSQSNRKELDLSLDTLWFAKSPAILPTSILGPTGKRMHSSTSGWTSSGARKTHTYSAIVQNEDLSRHKIHLTWDASNPGYTVKAQQKYIPPPRKLTANELEAYRQSYSDAVATWCESNKGRQVGDGECWTLANEGLKAVAANCTSYGTEPCLSSQSYIHGAQIYAFIPAQSSQPDPPGGVLEAGVARGDVIQIWKGIFKSKDGRRQQFAGDPDHTAVITSVEPNGILRVVESNVGGSKNVRDGSYDMSELTQGEVRIFRAVGENWIGKLDPTW